MGRGAVLAYGQASQPRRYVVGRRSRAFLALGWVVLAYIVGFTFASFAGVFK